MQFLPPRETVAALRQQAAAIVPALVTCGFTREGPEGRVAMLYSDPVGLGEFDLPGDGLAEPVSPASRGRRELGPSGLAARPAGAFGMFLRQRAVERLVGVDVPGDAPRARFWLGAAACAPLTDDQWTRLEALAESSAGPLHADPPESVVVARLRRLELAADLLPALLHELDVREVFDRLSAAARRALPHDLLMLRLFNADLTEITVYATSDGGQTVRTVPSAYPPAMVEAWSFDIVDDLALHPHEATPPPATLGARSALRLPIRLDGKVIGGLAILSFAPGAYAADDVPVARRLADHVAVGLSHHRLAEEHRRVEALRARAASLEMLDGLLSTLAGVLDIREVFERVSAITQAVLPHDALSIIEILADGARARIHASHGLGDRPAPYDVPLPVPALAADVPDDRIVDDYRLRPEYAGGPGALAGMRSSLFVSIGLEGRTFGGLNFYSRRPGRFTRDDLLVARRVTDHVALALSHRRLADQARVTEDLRARAANLDLLDDLLEALIDAVGLKDVFERISTIAGKVLPHDAALLLVRLPDGEHARVYASAGLPTGLPEVTSVPPALLENPAWEHHIYDELTGVEGARYRRLEEMGFRSLLRVPIRLEGRFAGALVFLATAPAAFGERDVAVARRMADRMAVTLARDRELDAERRADEAVERASRLEARVRALTDELDARTGYRRVVGESVPWRQVLTQATQVAATETTALLLGESGTGKEVVARFLHRASPRSAGPFLALNCAALPEHLLEAELFGYERGAFTGAVQSKPGQLELAAGGTLFLDEVGEMSAAAQAKVLRVLQEREFQRLGGTRVLRSDARVVAATNRDLARAIAQGAFREDLYYRLNVFAIRLPALRDRPEDVLPLSEAFLAEIGRGLGRPPAGISRDARQQLLAYRWPGNVRELRNVLERAAILCEGGLITSEFLALTVAPAPVAAPVVPVVSAPPSEAPGDAPPAMAVLSGGSLETMERTMIEQALSAARFNKSKAAKTLGLTRHQLYVRMRRHGLE